MTDSQKSRNMREKVYVERLFADYADSPELRDFKEEIAVNLCERVGELLRDGMSDNQAFAKATAELGNITAIADDAAQQKRAETIGQIYMSAKVPLNKRSAAGISTATALLLLALGTLLVNPFVLADVALYNISAVLLALACASYVFFGLTQETAAHYALGRNRALAYGAITLLGVLGAGLAVVSFLFAGWQLSGALALKLALVLLAICGLIFLLATETSRQKPWLKAMQGDFAQQYQEAFLGQLQSKILKHESIVDTVRAARFGVLSGALWLLAFALCITLGVFAGWDVAWLPPLFALPLQVLMVVGILKRAT